MMSDKINDQYREKRDRERLKLGSLAAVTAISALTMPTLKFMEVDDFFSERLRHRERDRLDNSYRKFSKPKRAADPEKKKERKRQAKARATTRKNQK